jgi:putative SOS response-associated peptidase YedK
MKRRCLVPAAGWYEWQGTAAPKQPHVLHLDQFRPFAMAGIWTARESRGVGWVHNFAIMTRPAEPMIASIHDRMPAIIRSADYAAWLDPDTPAADAERIAESPIHDIRSYAVSTYVNRPEHNDERCLAPERWLV